MKFLSITGPKADIDRVIDQYLSKYEIHLENALSELKSVASSVSYTHLDVYKRQLTVSGRLSSSKGTGDSSA